MFAESFSKICCYNKNISNRVLTKKQQKTKNNREVKQFTYNGNDDNWICFMVTYEALIVFRETY